MIKQPNETQFMCTKRSSAQHKLYLNRNDKILVTFCRLCCCSASLCHSLIQIFSRVTTLAYRSFIQNVPHYTTSQHLIQNKCNICVLPIYICQICSSSFPQTHLGLLHFLFRLFPWQCTHIDVLHVHKCIFQSWINVALPCADNSDDQQKIFAKW